MRLWSSKRHQKHRQATRVSTLFSSPIVYDVGDDHAFSTSSNGYGPQVIPDAGFRPNNLMARQLGDEIAEGRITNRRADSPVSDSSTVRKKHLEPWSTSTVNGPSSSNATPRLMDSKGERLSQDGLWSWIPHVAQSADDDNVRCRVKEVFLFAEQFVINYYSDQASAVEISQEALSNVNRSQLLPVGQLQGYLTEAVYPTTVIKHVLLSLILDLISLEPVGSEDSLLPEEFQNYIALAEARTRSNADEIPHVQPALSAYRVLSAYLHSNLGEDQNYLDNKERVLKQVAADFRIAFDQWLAKDKSEEDWATSFHLLIDKTASLGTFLFSQPSVFLFHWEMLPQDQSERCLPVSPRLLRVFDDDAQFREHSDSIIPMKCGKVFKIPVSDM